MITAEDARRILHRLTPTGDLWSDDAEVMSDLFDGLGDEVALFLERSSRLVENESSPGLARELLPEWEEELGVPGPCSSAGQSLAQRQMAVAAKLAAVGGQSRAFYIELAEFLGATVSIREYGPLRAGFRAGDRCWGTNWSHVWDVQSPEAAITLLRAGFRAGARVREWGNDLLECTLAPRAPAHTRVRFTYGTHESASDLDFGTVGNPTGTDLDFGTVLAPTGPDIDEGSL